MGFLCELVLFPCLFTTYNCQGNRDGHQGEERPPKYIDVEGGLQDPLGRVLLACLQVNFCSGGNGASLRCCTDQSWGGNKSREESQRYFLLILGL